MTAKKMIVTNDKGQTYECYVTVKAYDKSAGTRQELSRYLGSWEFVRTNKEPEEPNHWLWRTCEPYRLTASGICFSRRR